MPFLAWPLLGLAGVSTGALAINSVTETVGEEVEDTAPSLMALGALAVAGLIVWASIKD